jgi:hypothetical protein
LLKSKGHATMLTDGRRLVETGVTTPAELQKACGIVPDSSVSARERQCNG